MRQRLAVLVALVAIILTFFVCTEKVQADNGYEACFRSRTNSERTSRGISALRSDVRIDKIARDHSDNMARDGTIYHNENLSDELPPYEYAGENVGMGQTCDLIQDAFMDSPGHKANLLDRDYTHVGIGVTYDSADNLLYVTIDFFTPRSPPPPVAPRPTRRPTPRRTCLCG